MENQLKFDSEMALRLRKLYSQSYMDYGDFIEDCGLANYIIVRYLNGTRDTIDQQHLKALARALGLSPSDFYDMISGRKPVKGRFSI